MDLSLLRTGQKSGALASMFGFLADAYDDRLKDSMKRFTALAEPKPRSRRDLRGGRRGSRCRW